MQATCEKIHPFELAGLGKAPFRFTGVQTAADRAEVQSERAASGMMYTTNYSTSCDYCGQGIQNAFCLTSADGKSFKVGCDCIRKADDNKLVQVVSEYERDKRREKARVKREAKWQRERDLVAAFKAGRCELLRSQPHPKGREGATAYDYVGWCVDNHCVGAAVLKMIEGSLQ